MGPSVLRNNSALLLRVSQIQHTVMHNITVCYGLLIRRILLCWFSAHQVVRCSHAVGDKLHVTVYSQEYKLMSSLLHSRTNACDSAHMAAPVVKANKDSTAEASMLAVAQASMLLLGWAACTHCSEPHTPCICWFCAFSFGPH